MSRDNLKVWSLASILIFLLIQSAHANVNEIVTAKGGDFEISHHEPLPQINLLRKPVDPFKQDGDTPSWEWMLEAFGKLFHFELESNDRIIAGLPKEQREKIAEKVELYRGKIQGIEDSWIRLTKVGEEWSGMFWDGEEAYIIDPIDILSPFLTSIPLLGEFKYGLYRLSDTKNLTQFACGGESHDASGEPLSGFSALSQELEEAVSAEAVGASRNIDLAIVTDPLFSQIQNSFGKTNDEAVVARVNVVDGIYSEQVDVQIKLVEILELSSNGPLTSTDSATLLPQFGEFTNSPQFTHPGVAHLFTGRNLDGNIIGRAYLSSLCSARFGVGINEIRQDTPMNSIPIGSVLFAHELGHNFGAPHDNQGGSACASTPGSFIMSPVINNSQEFSQCSIDQMQPEINSSSCITVIDNTSTDVLLDLPPSPFDAPVANPFDYEIEVHNTGTLTANNVNAEMNVSSGLAIFDAAIGANTCSITGSSRANCSIGNIPPGQSRIITVNLQGQIPGQVSLDAEITADNDSNSSNNTARGIINLTNTDPTVTITSPQHGAFLSAENSISFVGEASDIEDGNLNNEIAWTSNRDGQLGNGSNISATLTIGTHQISASVTDSGGGQASAVIVIAVAEGLNESILFESHFDGGTDGFSYIDDAFRNTNEPAYAQGTRESNQGFTGGGLRVLLGGINNDDINSMSGGWTRTFNLATTSEVTVALRYTLTLAPEYETDELSQALLAVDGTLVGTDSNNYLAQIVGDGAGGNPQTTEWVPVVVNLGTLTGGPHTLAIGGYNNKKTFNNESTEVLIDDVMVRTTETSPPPPPPPGNPTVNITTPTDGASFVEGTSIGFSGQATADGGGDLTAQLVWTSDRDGQIGAGGSFSSILSLGTHRITASVTDSNGNQGSQDIMITVTEDTGSPILFESHFDSGSGGFSYVDNTFRNTNQPGYAQGTFELTQGFTGGGLRVLIGGLNNADITGMSGGWTRTFTLATSSEVTVTLRYKLTQAPEYETDELSQALLAVDGTLVGTGSKDYLAQIVGDGGGGNPQTTNWVQVVLNLGTLPNGPHTVTIGAYNNKKTFNDETTEILIDDVVVQTTSGSPPPPPPPPGGPIIAVSFDGGPDGFSYADDAFRNTNQPNYASGAHVANQGFSGGGLRVLLGGLDGNDILNMSGGWSRSFTLTSPQALTLTFRYNLTQDQEYENDEYSEALLAVDGVLRGNGPNQSLVRITGDGSGGSDQSTGWVFITDNLGTLPAGTHTITIGGFNNEKTWNDEVTEVLIDDVTLE